MLILLQGLYLRSVGWWIMLALQICTEVIWVWVRCFHSSSGLQVPKNARVPAIASGGIHCEVSRGALTGSSCVLLMFYILL